MICSAFIYTIYMLTPYEISTNSTICHFEDDRDRLINSRMPIGKGNSLIWCYLKDVNRIGWFVRNLDEMRKQSI